MLKHELNFILAMDWKCN